MAKQNLKDQENAQQEKVVETVSHTEQFFNKNKKAISIALSAILVIGLLVLCYYKFYYQPKKAEAMEQMFPAENNFRSQNYQLALEGDGNVLGFNQIIKEYGGKGGKVVYFYAGVCELQLGKYKEAVSNLKKYKVGDKIMQARGLACIGDAYVGLEKYSDAIAYFRKAANKADNIYAATYLLKAGVAYEELKKPEEALKLYKEIKDKYPQSVEGYDIDKYISRIESQQTAK